MRGVFLFVLGGLAAPALGQGSAQKSDWEKEQERREWKEAEVRLPAYPATQGLVEFPLRSSRFRFFVDAASLSVGPDGVVRYTLVARSPSGVANISYEGMHCATLSYKIFALGNDGRWSSRESEWRAIESKVEQGWHYELRTNYFCPNRDTIETAAEGLDALRRGGHPAISINRLVGPR